jgi:hypothetical protein
LPNWNQLVGKDFNVSSVNTIQVPIIKNWKVFGEECLRTFKGPSKIKGEFKIL